MGSDSKKAVAKTKYGYFDMAHDEYVVTNPATPVKDYFTYLFNDSYCALVSHTGRGTAFVGDDPSMRSIMEWWSKLGREARVYGRNVFISEELNGKTRVICPLWQPAMEGGFDEWESRIGLGYVKVRSVRHELETEITFFVPTQEPCELWQIRIHDLSGRKRHLKLFCSIDPTLGAKRLACESPSLNFLRYFVSADRPEVEGHKLLGLTIQKKGEWWDGDPDLSSFFFLTGATRFDGSRRRFFGDMCQRVPRAVLGDCTNSEEGGDSICAALQAPLEIPALGETVNLCLLGSLDLKGPNNQLVPRDHAEWRQEILTRFLGKAGLDNASKEFEATRTKWKELIHGTQIHIETPVPEVDAFFNTWNKYQIYITNRVSRCLSDEHEGSGGMGFRDKAQDIDGLIPFNPERSREYLVTMATVGVLRRDGSCVPGWSSVRGPYDYDNERVFRDHSSGWLQRSVSNYIKETGDLDLLFEKVVYSPKHDNVCKDPSWINKADEQATLIEALLRQVTYLWRERLTDPDKHGLIPFRDWNDALDKVGERSESVWISLAYVGSITLMREMIELLIQKGKAEPVIYLKKGAKKEAKVSPQEILADLQLKSDEVAACLLKHAWEDGHGFIQGFREDNTRFGSREDVVHSTDPKKDGKKGRKFLMPLAWGVLTMRDYLDERKLHELCESMMGMDTKYGIPLLAPGYDPLAPGTKEDQDKIGRIALFQDGDKENAAIFVHACLMAARAFYVARRGDDAFNVLKKITPSLQDDPDVYCNEPFATAEYLRGPGCEEFGRGRYTTVTGSAAWYFRVVLEGLFGIQSGYEGLEIVPNFPSHWLGHGKSVRMKRDFRGATYEIEYHLGKNINQSYSITVNGQPIEGNHLVLLNGRNKGQPAIKGKGGKEIPAESGDLFKVVVK